MLSKINCSGLMGPCLLLQLSSLLVVAVVVAAVLLPCCLCEIKGESFESQVESINQEVEKWFKNELNPIENVKKLIAHGNEAQSQSKTQHWPRGMMKILQVATGVAPTGSVDMNQVRRIVAGLQHNDQAAYREFKENRQRDLDSKLKHASKLDDAMDKLKITDDLCYQFRQKGKGKFNYTKAIQNLILLKQVENIDDETFIKRVVQTNEPIAPLYSASIICRRLVEDEGIFLPDNHVRMVKHWPYARLD